ncbi:MAG TPA: EAL domain-containing protein [Gemmatimonadales bacterium]|jgi:diguanylate cyclase (GGDEF)-like protein/PAS domain S-box-containing protein|nr:EAL domain-containing protein [Gemmatimonadales bacterium]
MSASDASPDGGPIRTVPAPRPRPPVGTLALLTALYALAYLLWERSDWGSPALRNLLGNVAFMPLNVGVVVLFALASRSRILDPGVRRALRLMATGSAMVFIGNAISVWYLEVLHVNPPVSWADPFYLSDSLLTVAALLAFPLARRTRLERWKFLLDAAMVLLGGAVALWYLSVRPTVASEGSSLVVTLMAFAYPLASLLVLLGVTTVLLRRPTDANRAAFALLVAGTVVGLVADLTFNWVSLEANARSAAWTDAVYLLCYVMLIASAELYLRRPMPLRVASNVPVTRLQQLSPLPYVAVATTYGLLLWVAVRPWSDPVSGLAVGALLITALVVTRQLLTVRENLRLLAETAARQNEARFRSLVQHSSDVILIIKTDGTIRFVSPSATQVFGYDPATMLRQTVSELLHPDDRERAATFFRDAAKSPGVTGPVELRFRQPDGSWLHAEILATNLLRDASVKGIVLNTRDVSERKRLEEQLTHQAFHDPLTGLANRALFRDRVSHALALAQRRGHPITVLFLDLDDFKMVNDSLGHAEGDRLLIAAAERFLSCARSTDTVARLGGDEFAILIEGAEGREGLLERLTAAMVHSFSLSGNQVRVTASIGVAAAVGGESADDLLRNADVAMYEAKRHGKGRSATYESRMYADIRERLDLEAALRGALERRELVLHYQPIVQLQSGAIYGVEALLRWEHPQYGRLLPQHFVPLAEETGLIVQLGAWVLDEACRQLEAWNRAHPESVLAVSVNISGRQLQGAGLADALRRALASSGVDPAKVVLEITESVLMQETESVLDRLRQLKALGVRLAIDDFGTGYSSLSYLQRFPIDILKIAKPFVEEVGKGADRSALARAIIGLGDTLRLDTIAEGIEMAEQRAALLQLGCTLGQGHYFWPALPAAAVEELLAAGRLPAAPAAR